MTKAEIAQRPRSLGLKTTKRTKAELIQEIQVAEGNFPCYGTADDYCDQFDCLWREDCLGKGR